MLSFYIIKIKRKKMFSKKMVRTRNVLECLGKVISYVDRKRRLFSERYQEALFEVYIIKVGA
jgi:hypothetical protein